jgi:hypothetical protein
VRQSSPIIQIGGWNAVLLAGFIGIVGVPLGLITPTTFTFLNIPIWSWFNILAWRKRRYKWGRVVTPLVPDGIPGAQVYLYDLSHYNRLVDRTLTDKLGQYGFLTPPGKYAMKVVHPAYTFPSKVDFSGYHGAAFEIDERSGMIQTDIPLDPATPKSIVANAFRSVVLSVRGLRRVLLVVGSLLTIYNFTQPGFVVLNLLFLAYYTYLWIDEFRSSKKRRHLLTIRNAQNQPIPFSLVRIKTAENKVVFNRASDALGRVFILVPAGNYTLEIVTPSHEGQPARITHQLLSLPEGYLEKALTLRLREDQ